MRAKLATLGMAVVVVVALVFEVSLVTFANQENANVASTAKPRKKRVRRSGQKRMMSGVPMGVDQCLNHLAQMAASDPLPDYEGHPSEIINNGLLWTDSKSKCAVSDQAQREKIFEVANAWRMKDAAKVRSLLQELGASSSSSTGAEAQPATETTTGQPAATPRRGRRRIRKQGAAAAEPTATETQAAPPNEGTGNVNRPARRTRRPARNRNGGTANSNNANSGF
ncbi:MAG TPA: hypothetical protein VJZ26_00335 [Blastocatellia bacterium]|nr:hypothetical protein [Blastocatellia bacterium]